MPKQQLDCGLIEAVAIEAFQKLGSLYNMSVRRKLVGEELFFWKVTVFSGPDIWIEINHPDLSAAAHMMLCALRVVPNPLIEALCKETTEGG